MRGVYHPDGLRFVILPCGMLSMLHGLVYTRVVVKTTFTTMRGPADGLVVRMVTMSIVDDCFPRTVTLIGRRIFKLCRTLWQGVPSAKVDGARIPCIAGGVSVGWQQ